MTVKVLQMTKCDITINPIRMISIFEASMTADFALRIYVDDSATPVNRRPVGWITPVRMPYLTPMGTSFYFSESTHFSSAVMQTDILPPDQFSIIIKGTYSYLRNFLIYCIMIIYTCSQLLGISSTMSDMSIRLGATHKCSRHSGCPCQYSKILPDAPMRPWS